MKTAVLVTANVTTRVIIDVEEKDFQFENPLSLIEYEKAVKKAKGRLINNLINDYEDMIEDVRIDTECPYNENLDENFDNEITCWGN